MSEFLAEAQIVVRADTAKFISDFEKAVKQVEKQKVTVTVRASTAGFRDDLVAKLKRSEKGLVVRVRVRPDMKGFREALQTGVTSASKGVVATVGVRAGAARRGAPAVAAPSVATGGVVDKRAANAQLALNAAIDAGVASRRRITGALSDEEKFTTRLAREELFLKASVDAVSKAAVAGVPELLALAEAQERAARAAVAASRAQQERRTLGVPIGVTTADFKAQITAQEQLQALERDHAAAITRNAEFDRKAAKQRLDDMAKLHAAALVENRDRDAARRAALLGPASNLTRERNRLGQFISGGGAAIGAEAAERNRLATASIKGRAAAEAEIAKAQRIAATAALVEGDAERRLVASRSVLRVASEAVVVAEEALTAALASGSVFLAENARETLRLVAAEQAQAAAAARAAEAEATRAGFLTTARRAIVAQIANLTGLRGAALTAATGFIAVSAAAIGLRKAVGIASDLEDELAVFKVTSGATADQMEQVSKRAEELGKDITLPAVSAADAGTALTELSKAGLSVQDAMDGARGVLQLATAANIDFTAATNLSASALNAFGLAGSEASHVADVLANSANESQGSITDAGVALQQSAAVARQAGLSLEQTVAALTLFARAGLRGSDAGTSLRTALIRLINPSEKAEKVIQRLGLRVRDASGNIDLSVFQQFTDATRKMTAAQRDQALAVVFGQDAIRGAAILAREGTAGLTREEAAINKAGTAAEVAGARTSGLSGALENLKNQIADVGLTLGQSMLPGLTDFTRLAAGSVARVSEIIDAFKDFDSEVQDFRESIKEPFDIVINFIKKKTGFGSNEDPTDPKQRKPEELTVQTRIKNIFSSGENLSEFLGDFSAIGKEAGASFSDSFTGRLLHLQVRFPRLPQARKQVKDLVDSFNLRQGSTSLNETIIGLTDLQKKLEGGTLGTKNFAKQLDPVIKKLERMAELGRTTQITLPKSLKIPQPEVQPPTNISIPLPQSIVSLPRRLGKISSDAGKSAIDQLRDSFNPNEFTKIIRFNYDKLIGQATTDSARFAHTGELGPKAFGEELQKGLQTAFLLGVAEVKQGTQALTNAMNEAIIAGAGPKQLRSIAQKQLDAALKIAADARARLKSLPKGPSAARKKTKGILDAALETAAGLTGNVKGFTDQITSDAKEKADAVTKARDEADQKFLDALARGRTPFERQITRAQQTPGANDDVAALRAMRKRLKDERDQVASGVKDVKTRTKELQRLDGELFDNNIALQAARKQRNDAIVQALTDRGVAIQNLGDATGSLRLVIRGLDLQIKAARETLIKAKALKIGVDAAKAALEALKKTKRETIQSARDSLLGEAFRLAEARGNKDQMVAIIDLQIAEARRALSKAKSAVDKYTQLANIQELINKKRDILKEEVDKQNQGTSVLDILRQNVETFNASAGNLVFANQPFAGPNAFNADIAQFLKFQGKSATRGITSSFLTHDPADLRFGQPKEKRAESTTNELIAALKALTEATLSASGNKSTAGRGGAPSSGGSPWAGRPWFSAGGWSRQFQES